ncbi:MAG: hypothetical protein Q8K92_26360 [Leadbetterella sp.]|nr:hypothetical protein [Leadbetterella sp.]
MFYEVYFQEIQTGLFEFDKVPAIFVMVEDNSSEFFVPKNSPVVLWLAEDCRTQPEKITCDLNGKFFGYGNVLEIAEKSSEGFLLKAELPKVYSISLETCPVCKGLVTIEKNICLNCNGSGVTNKACSRCLGAGCDEIYDHECFKCGGKGIETTIDWTDANELLANLQFLFRLLNSRLIDTETKQEIEYAPLISKKPYSVNIGASIDRPIAEWLFALNGSKSFERVGEVMEIVYMHMRGEKGIFDRIVIEIKPEEGAFFLQCPGDRCSLYGNKSFDLNTHNIDNPLQVFTLWAGLAELERLRNQ